METTNQRFGLQPQRILSCHSYFGVALCRVRALGGVVKALCEPRTSVGAGKPSGKRRTSAITEQVSVHHVTHAMASFATWLEDNPPMRRVSHLALQAYHDHDLPRRETPWSMFACVHARGRNPHMWSAHSTRFRMMLEPHDGSTWLTSWLAHCINESKRRRAEPFLTEWSRSSHWGVTHSGNDGTQRRHTPHWLTN